MTNERESIIWIMKIFVIEDHLQEDSCGLSFQEQWEGWIWRSSHISDKFLEKRFTHWINFQDSLQFILAQNPTIGLEWIKREEISNILWVMCDMRFDGWQCSIQKDRGLGSTIDYCKRQGIPLQLMTGSISEMDMRVAEDHNLSLENSGGNKFWWAFNQLVYNILVWNDESRKQHVIQSLSPTI